jgi:RNA polymerase sigma-70 factor, ECF subfamily
MYPAFAGLHHTNKDLLLFMKHDLPSMTDTELYEILCQGQYRDEAFKTLYHRYKGRVHAYCRKIAGSEYAGDLMQETFVRFYTSSHSDRQMVNVAGYLMTIARNLCLSHKERVQKRLVEFRSLDELEIPDIQDDPTNDEELRFALTGAIDLLGDEYKEALLLQVYSGMSYEEIGNAIGKPVSTVRNRIVRAKTKLRSLLEPFISANSNGDE